jgi:hypothetical protein
MTQIEEVKDSATETVPATTAGADAGAGVCARDHARCGALSLTWWKTRALPAVGHGVCYGAVAGVLMGVYICALAGKGPKNPDTLKLLARSAVGGAAAMTAAIVAVHGASVGTTA